MRERVIVCGSVAVDRRIARVGNGGGYSDLEFALLVTAGLVDRQTVIATMVHPLPHTGADRRHPRPAGPAGAAENGEAVMTAAGAPQ